MVNRYSKLLLFCSLSFLLVFLLSFVSTEFEDDGNPAQNVADCGILNTSGAVYNLTQDIGRAGANCIMIANDSITLDCQGYTITINGSGGEEPPLVAVSTQNYSHITVKNCIFAQNFTFTGEEGGQSAVVFTNSTNSTIFNNTFEVSGISFVSSINSNITANIMNNSVGTAISLQSASNSNVVQDNNITTGSVGIYVSESHNVNISSNNFTSITTGSINQSMMHLEDSDGDIIDHNIIKTSGTETSGISMSDAHEAIVNLNTITTLGDDSKGIFLNDGITGSNITTNTITTSGVDSAGILARASPESNILFNNTIVTNDNESAGIFLEGATDTNVSSNTITTSGNQSAGIALMGSNDSVLTQNIVQTEDPDSCVIDIEMSGYNNTIYNNIFNTSSMSVGPGACVDDALANIWNITEEAGTNIIGRDVMGGNFWTNNASTGFSDICLDADGDYICDDSLPLDLEGGGNVDYLPLTDHINKVSGCDTLDVADKCYVLNQSVTGYNGTCFNISANNITLDFAGHSITGNTTGYGVNVTDYNDTVIINGLIYNFSMGIYLADNQDNTVANMTLNNNNESGIEISGSANNNLTGITANSNNYHGIYLNLSSNNILTGNTVNSNTFSAIYLYNCSNNVFTNFVINDSGQDAILLTSAESDNNNFTNVVVTNTNTDYYDINFATEGIDGTWIENIEFANYSFTGAGGKVNFKEPSFGEIVFLEAINGSGISLKYDVDIEPNKVFVNGSKPGLNKSANISLYDINYTVPSQRQQYSSDDSTWADCNLTSDPVCNYLSYDPDEDILVFNVSHFTYFKATVDATAPVVTLTESSSTTTSLTITVSKTDTLGSGISSCTSSRGTLSGTTLTETGLSCGVSYTYTVTCTDYAENSGSDAESFSTDNCVGGGGETSFWTMTYVDNLNEAQEEAGYSKALKEKHRMKVTINDVYHYVGVIDLTSTTATINVSSDPYQAVFNIGDEKKFDVTDDDYYDLLVKLNSIDDIKASVTVKYVHEEVPEEELSPEVTECESDADCSEGYKCVDNVCEEEEVEEASTAWIWIVIVVIVLLIIVGITYGLRKRKTRGLLGIEAKK